MVVISTGDGDEISYFGPSKAATHLNYKTFTVNPNVLFQPVVFAEQVINWKSHVKMYEKTNRNHHHQLSTTLMHQQEQHPGIYIAHINVSKLGKL